MSTPKDYVLINVTSRVEKEKHISYFVMETPDEISLLEVLERSYQQSGTPTGVLISRIETQLVKSVKINSLEASSLHLLKYALQNIDLQWSKIKRG